MPDRAKDPFKTKSGISAEGLTTFRTIAARLKGLKPSILIEAHIAEQEEARRFPKVGKITEIQAPERYSTLVAHPSTLDGIDFIAVNPRALIDAYASSLDPWGETALASMQGDPCHWALKASFKATFGTGFREVWRPMPYVAVTAPEESGRTNLMSMRFGTPMRFTALHCAVHESTGKCNVHIDQSGFVLGLPKGWSVTANLYDHIANELILKTDIRNWLSGLTSNETAKKVIKEIVRRVSIVFPNLQNEMADLNRRLHNLRRPETPWGLLTTIGRTIAPVGVTVDAYENDKFKVQVHGTIANGDSAITVTLGGTW
jgi:hypothetical protein